MRSELISDIKSAALKLTHDKPFKIYEPCKEATPQSSFAIKYKVETKTHNKDAYPWKSYNFIARKYEIHYETAVVVSYRWLTFNSAIDVISWCHRTHEKPFDKSQKQLLCYKSYAIDGQLVSAGDFISSLRLFKTDHDSSHNFDALAHLGISSELAALRQLKVGNNVIDVGNPPNAEQFLSYLGSDNATHQVTALFHGTWRSNIAYILQHGLLCSRRGALGPGIYLGKYDKAFTFAIRPRSSLSKSGKHTYIANRLRQYASTATDMCDTKLVLLECDVILDNLETITSTHINKTKPDFDLSRDAYTSAFKRPEWCVRDHKRVIINKIHIAT